MAGISGSSFKPVSVDQWLEFVNSHEGLNHYPSIAQRTGSLVLMGAVEHHLFAKDKEKFHATVLEWGGADWNVFSAPKERHEDIKRTARALAMKVCINPPAMLFFGQSAMVLTVPAKASEAEVKAAVKKAGVPAALIDLFSGKQSFPGNSDTIHAIENDPALLKRPVAAEEKGAIAEREFALVSALDHGVVPTVKAMADYVYGPNRVLAPKL